MLFSTDHNKKISVGFSLIELLIVVAIIGILASIMLSFFQLAYERSYMARSDTEMRQIVNALQLYYEDYHQYPSDADRGLPPGLEKYLAPGRWPEAAWPESVYDWDNWHHDPSDPQEQGQTFHPPEGQIYQISIRFCEMGDPETCRFPQTSWAENFEINSSYFYCIEGPCRSHPNEDLCYPGYCVNCNNPHPPYDNDINCP